MPAALSLARLELDAILTGRYAIDRELGQGGMGIVYLARDLSLDRLVAIKQLPEMLAALPSIRERFLRESRTVAGLSHPNIVPIHSVEERGSIVLFVMAYVEGESLADRLRRTGRLPPREVVSILQGVAWALSHAHARGIVHRDVKPENILLEHATGRALLADFGIAQIPGSQLTGHGINPGTPHYMSPEQASGDLVDGRSDLYSLGVVGFYALTGRLPFEAESAQAVIGMHLGRPPPSVLTVEPAIPRRLGEAVDRCLRKDPATRWPSAEAFVRALPGVEPTYDEVAPPVRNFHRAASLALNQVVLLAIVLPALLLLRPSAADLLVPLIIVAPLAILLQLRRRARLLVAQGFSYQDLRAAVHLDQIRRQEEQEGLAAVQLRTAPLGVGGFVWLLGLVGVGLIASRWLPGHPTGDLGRTVLGLGIGLLLLFGIVLVAGQPKRRGGIGSVVARLLVSRAGEWLFHWWSRGGTKPRASGGPAAKPDQGSWERLGPTERRALEALGHAVADLEAQAHELARRESAIAEELASAAWRERTASSPNVEDLIRERLSARRDQLVGTMKAAQARFRSEREHLELTIDNLRMLGTELRSGLASVDQLVAEIAEARRLLGSLSDESPRVVPVE